MYIAFSLPVEVHFLPDSSHVQDLLNKSYAFSLSTTLTVVLTALTVSHPLPLLDIVRFMFHTIVNIVHSQTRIPDTLMLLLALVCSVCFFVWIAEINAGVLTWHICF